MLNRFGVDVSNLLLILRQRLDIFLIGNDKTSPRVTFSPVDFLVIKKKDISRLHM